MRSPLDPIARENPTNPPAHSHRTHLPSLTQPATPCSSIAQIDPNRASFLTATSKKNHPFQFAIHSRYQDFCKRPDPDRKERPFPPHVSSSRDILFAGRREGWGGKVVHRCTAWDRFVSPRIRDVSEPLRRLPTWTVGVCDGRRLGRGVRLRVR